MFWKFFERKTSLIKQEKSTALPSGPIFVQQGGRWRLAQIEQKINGSTQMPLEAIDEMMAQRNDLQYQFSLCQRIMAQNSILPFPFGRAVILLHKAGRCDEELEICRYVKAYLDGYSPDPPWAADLRKSPTLIEITSRPIRMKHHAKTP